MADFNIPAPTSSNPDLGAHQTGVPGDVEGQNQKSLLSRDAEQRLARALEQQWREAVAWYHDPREEGREDRRFYDNQQWTSTQLRKLREEGRPPTTINRIFKAINNLAGRERESRYSWRTLPRGSSDKASADIMTKSLAYVADQTRVRYVISRAFKDALKGPVGWMEVGIDDEDLTNELIYVRYVDPFEIWWDPNSIEPDLSDARYLIRSRWVDEDLVRMRFKDKWDELHAALTWEYSKDPMRTAFVTEDYGNQGRIDTAWTGHDPYFGEPDWADASRKKIRLREHWWWQNHPVAYLTKPGFTPIVVNPEDPRLGRFMMEHPDARIRAGTFKVFHFAICGGNVILETGVSPYPFQRYNYIPVWAFRDDYGRPYGVIRNQKDPQRELNVARSRFNESIRDRQLLYEEGALGAISEDQARRKISRANFALKVTDLNRVRIQNDSVNAPLWLRLHEMSAREIDDVVGLNEASYGAQGNEKSGRAIQSRILQQGLTYAEVFDNLRFARQILGECILALMQAYYEPEKLARIAEVQYQREMGYPAEIAWAGKALANPISDLKFDVIVSDEAETVTQRQAAFDQARELLQYLPPPAQAVILPDIIRMSDWAGADAMAAKAEQAMGMLAGGPSKSPETSYRDAPEDLKRQIEQRDGFQPSQLPVGHPGNPATRRNVPKGMSLPQGSLPQGSLPQGSLPQGSLPQGSLPQGSLPQGAGELPGNAGLPEGMSFEDELFSGAGLQGQPQDDFAPGMPGIPGYTR